jgi:penicillin-binding protein 1A
METVFTKEEILTNYMNRIYFGSGLFGIETASQAYFGKPPCQVYSQKAKATGKGKNGRDRS